MNFKRLFRSKKQEILQTLKSIEAQLNQHKNEFVHINKFMNAQILSFKRLGITACFDLYALRGLHAGLDSVKYIESTTMATAPRFRDRGELWNYIIEKFCHSDGLFLEFGVFSGESINRFADLKPECRIYGFDSFEGLPEDWSAGVIFKKGTFAREDAKLPEVRKNVSLIKGWFNETLPPFIAEHPDETCTFIHIDCDLYSSTKTVLSLLKAKIKPGTVLLFDEYFNYPGWRVHEHRAFLEFVEANEISYEYIGYNLMGFQVAVIIK